MNLPNKITTARMLLAVIIISLLLFPYQLFNITVPYIFGEVNSVYFAAFILFLLASISDFFDGYLARKHNLITDYGKFMDPIADKLLVNGLLIILLVPHATAAYDSNQLAMPVVAVLVMIARDLIVDGLRLVAATKKIVMAANIFGKVKTVLQMVAIGLFLLNDWPFSLLYGDKGYVSIILIYIAALVSLLSGIIYIVQNVNVLKGEENEK